MLVCDSEINSLAVTVALSVLVASATAVSLTGVIETVAVALTFVALTGVVIACDNTRVAVGESVAVATGVGVGRFTSSVAVISLLSVIKSPAPSADVVSGVVLVIATVEVGIKVTAERVPVNTSATWIGVGVSVGSVGAKRSTP